MDYSCDPRCGSDLCKGWGEVKDWTREQRARKWRWAGHIARRQDGRWGTALLDWTPEGGARAVGRPCARWADALDQFVCKTILEFTCDDVSGLQRGEWQLLAQDRDGWDA